MRGVRSSWPATPAEPAGRDDLRPLARGALKRGVAVIWLEEVRDDISRALIEKEAKRQTGEGR